MRSSRDLVLFDFDGTIADSLAIAIQVYNEIAPSLRIPRITADDDRLRHMNPREALRANAIPMWKVPPLIVAIRFRLRSRIDAVPIFPDIAAAIDELRAAGHRCAIVSSNSRENIERFLARNRIEGLEILATGVGLFGKPKALRKALRTAGATAANAVYVGDETRDIVAAREVGMRSIAVSWGYAGRSALVATNPTHVVDTPRELVAAVRGTRDEARAS